MATAPATNVVDLRDRPSLKGKVSPEEWQARVDLAACYRLADLYGWADAIYNHVSLRVPGEPDFFLIKAHELLYEEVTASNLVKCDMRNDDVDERLHVNRPGFTLHGGILRVRPEINCVYHTHIEACITVSNQKDGLLPISQSALQFMGDIGYHEYEGITENLGERERIAVAMAGKRHLLMRNHGAVTTGKSARDAFMAMRELETACKLQLAQQAAGAPHVMVSEGIVASYIEQRRNHDSGRGSADWPAWQRRLDRIDPTWRT
ncbi:MAG: class II aldolase/adducin family protein [Alphaproteobacteria bacterium]